MSIGKTYKETLQKAIRGLERGRAGLGFVKNFHDLSLEELLKLLSVPNSERHFQMYEALRKGATDDQIFKRTGVKAWSSPVRRRRTGVSSGGLRMSLKCWI